MASTLDTYLGVYGRYLCGLGLARASSAARDDLRRRRGHLLRAGVPESVIADEEQRLVEQIGPGLRSLSGVDIKPLAPVGQIGQRRLGL